MSSHSIGEPHDVLVIMTVSQVQTRDLGEDVLAEMLITEYGGKLLPNGGAIDLPRCYSLAARDYTLRRSSN
jgi:hypothetical protein